MGIFDWFSSKEDSDDSDDSHIHDSPEAGRTYPSHPHSSKAEPKEHIDTHVYRDGKREKENESYHLTDKGHVMWGRNRKEWEKKEKDKK